MATSRTRANRKYNDKTYDQIKIQLRKGIRDTWKIEAEKRGLSLASLILQAVSEFLENHPTVENAQKND